MVTLRELLADYSGHLRSIGYGKRTIRTYREECAMFLGRMEENHQIRCPDSLGKSHLLLWQRHLALRRNREGAPLSARTVNRKITSVKGFLKYAVERGVILSGTDVLRYVKQPQFLPKGVVPHAKITGTFRTMPAGKASDYRNRAMLELLYTTGLRARELLGMDMSSLNLSGATATVMGKGMKERTVPVGKTAMRHLQTYIAAFRPLLLRDPSEQALFISPWGARLSYNTFRLIVHRSFDKPGDRSVTPHTFRRSCATELIKGGANLYHVKEILGHASLDTLKHYVRLNISDLQKTHRQCHPREKD